jgi:hypothetical protein
VAVQISKTDLTRPLENYDILHERFNSIAVWCVNTRSAVPYSDSTLRPPKHICFEQVRALLHIHYTLASWDLMEPAIPTQHGSRAQNVCSSTCWHIS